MEEWPFWVSRDCEAACRTARRALTPSRSCRRVTGQGQLVFTGPRATRTTHLAVLLAIRPQLSTGRLLLHLELEAVLAGAGDVEGRVAVALGALDASSHSFPAEVADLCSPRGSSALVAKSARSGTAHQLPPTPANVFHAVDWLHVDCVADSSVGNPDGAEQVSPLRRCRLLEGAVRVRAEDTRL